MAVTATIELPGPETWVEVATGAGAAELTLDSQARKNTALWALTASSAAPGGTVEGHIVQRGENVSMQLEAGEHLHVRGTGRLTVTADNPV